MRIVGGRLGGRRFTGPPGDQTRPTAERVREAIASALMSRGRIEGATVLDLFAGTGAMAFEALSRGARHATLVDAAPRVVRAIEESARELGLAAEVTVRRLDLLRDPTGTARALGALLAEPPSLVFVDPPYAEIEGAVALVHALAKGGALHPEATVVLEYGGKVAPSLAPPLTASNEAPALATEAAYRYGDTGVLLLRASAS